MIFDPGTFFREWHDFEAKGIGRHKLNQIQETLPAHTNDLSEIKVAVRDVDGHVNAMKLALDGIREEVAAGAQLLKQMDAEADRLRTSTESPPMTREMEQRNGFELRLFSSVDEWLAEFPRMS